jgi:hypothetical protein
MFPIFLREIKSGLYTTDSYYLANIFAMVRKILLKKSRFQIYSILAAWIDCRAFVVCNYCLLAHSITSNIFRLLYDCLFIDFNHERVDGLRLFVCISFQLSSIGNGVFGSIRLYFDGHVRCFH